MDILNARYVPPEPKKPTKAELHDAWARACDAHDEARFAEWHAGKAEAVEAARSACMAARRAYYAAT